MTCPSNTVCLFLTTLFLALSTTSASLWGLINNTWVSPYYEEEINCEEVLAMSIACRGNCAIPDQVEARSFVRLDFEVDIETGADQEWQVEFVNMAASSVTRPFEYLLLPSVRTVALEVPFKMSYSIQADEIVGDFPILMATGKLVNEPGYECQIQAVYQ